MNFQHYFYDGTDMSALHEELVHPRQTLALPGANEVLQILACAPAGSVLCDRHSAVQAYAAKQLCRTGVLRSENNHLYFDCPIILQKDQKTIECLTARQAKRIAKLLTEIRHQLYDVVVAKQDGFPPQRHLYHMLCGGVLDGTIFDHLEESCLVSTSKPLITGVDCLTIIYEDHPSLNRFSDGLLCSFNRLRTDECTFVSFGDSEGFRRDLYRWFMCRSTQKTILTDTPLDNMLASSTLDELRSASGKYWHQLVQGRPIPDAWLGVYQHFGYLHGDQPCVPIYTVAEIKHFQSALDKLIVPLILPVLHEVLQELAAENSLTSITHGVKPADLANEIYHILFGQINEHLVYSGLVSRPSIRSHEGRYLNCVEMNT